MEYLIILRKTKKIKFIYIPLITSIFKKER